ncbi:hypothetical protein BZG36_02512 [Bifiguratus adelaidae]|uniref:RING-type domain-containing protein n=1 Tax=Bifiguratus adelaidae TaxID=1938954 RepID=A0A261Y2Q7_9FUNG|nr:hypothetical protein BZG36_02512 [Bifiguratus adelaidae]
MKRVSVPCIPPSVDAQALAKKGKEESTASTLALTLSFPPHCFCKLPAHRSISADFDVVYDCHSYQFEKDPSNATSSVDGTNNQTPRVACAFHVHWKPWCKIIKAINALNDIALPLLPRTEVDISSDLAICPYFNFTFCVVLGIINMLPKRTPPNSKCFCGLNTKIVMLPSNPDEKKSTQSSHLKDMMVTKYFPSYTRGKIQFRCPNYDIDGARPKCTFAVLGNRAPFFKPNSCIHRTVPDDPNVAFLKTDAAGESVDLNSNLILSLSKLDVANRSDGQHLINPSNPSTQSNTLAKQDPTLKAQHPSNSKEDNTEASVHQLHASKPAIPVLPTDTHRILQHQDDVYARGQSPAADHGAKKWRSIHSNNPPASQRERSDGQPQREKKGPPRKDFSAQTSRKFDATRQQLQDFRRGYTRLLSFQQLQPRTRVELLEEGVEKENDGSMHVPVVHLPSNFDYRPNCATSRHRFRPLKSRARDILYATTPSVPKDVLALSEHFDAVKTELTLVKLQYRNVLRDKDALSRQMGLLKRSRDSILAQQSHLYDSIDQLTTENHENRQLRERSQKHVVELETVVRNLLLENETLAEDLAHAKDSAAFNDLKCRICFQQSITTAIIPCFHMVLCTPCAEKVSECVICRTKKQDVQTVYLG